VNPEGLALFLAVVAVGAWLQSVTGFALALSLLGTMTLFELAPIQVTAVVVSLLGLAGSLIALIGQTRAIQWRRLWPIAAGMLPTVALGVWLLDRLAVSTTGSLQLVLGLFIVAGGALMLLQPATRKRPARWRTGYLAGLLGGLFGGLFAAVAPPVVFHLYRGLSPLPRADDCRRGPRDPVRTDSRRCSVAYELRGAVIRDSATGA